MILFCARVSKYYGETSQVMQSLPLITKLLLLNNFFTLYCNYLANNVIAKMISRQVAKFFWKNFV